MRERAFSLFGCHRLILQLSANTLECGFGSRVSLEVFGCGLWTNAQFERILQGDPVEVSLFVAFIYLFVNQSNVDHIG